MNNQIVTILVLSLQDPGTPPARRIWSSIDMGTEIFVSDKDEVAEWTISDFDVTFTWFSVQNSFFFQKIPFRD
jgi:hypothetical protein